MRYLLDVNTLLALAVLEHEFHARVASWVERLRAKALPEFATCSITELGFVRLLGQAQQYGSSVAQARELLMKVKSSDRVRWFSIEDDHDIARLPTWVRTPKQTTDGHLAGLAKAHESILARLDRRMPGAFFVPTGRRS
jgi:uncharacterized protein